MEKLLTQTEDYNCGVFALEYLLRLKGINLTPEVIEVGCKTDKENGTSHDNIMEFLEKSYIPFGFSYDCTISYLFNHEPCLVNYQYENDGHYGIVVGHDDKNLKLYNPATGKMETMNFHTFEENWYSDRYGKRWLLFLK